MNLGIRGWRAPCSGGVLVTFLVLACSEGGGSSPAGAGAPSANAGSGGAAVGPGSGGVASTAGSAGLSNGGLGDSGAAGLSNTVAGSGGTPGTSGAPGAGAPAIAGSPATGGAGGAPAAGAGGTTAPVGGSAGSGGSQAAGTAGAAGSGADACDARKAVASMKVGWNLGNSLDATDPSKSDDQVETAWGNPKVAPALIEAVAKSGFGVIRIPVTWIGRFGNAPDYTIRPAFFARVEEVVNYVLSQGLYAIVNVHHDGAEGVNGQWISLVNESGQVDAAHNARVVAQFEKIWQQIADRFAGYGERLIFESMNEIKVGYDTPPKAHLDQVNVLNQTFVSTVRARGGKNATRCLVVPGYNTNIDHTLAGFVAPTDTSPGKLILSAHFYDPWSFAGAATTHTWGAGAPGVDNWGQEDWVRSVVSKLKAAYIDQGLPVIWGEYGAVNQTGYENYVRYYVEYVTKATKDAGIVPVLWDNGALSSGAEAFGLFDRSNNSPQYPALLEAIQRAITSSYALADVAKP